jgi:hypothetical protein
MNIIKRYKNTWAGKCQTHAYETEKLGWVEVAHAYSQAENAFTNKNYRKGHELMKKAREMETPLINKALRYDALLNNVT